MSGSRLGLQGRGGLGNRLKAVFLLEYALTDGNTGIGSGTGATSSRQTYVGLSDNRFGTSPWAASTRQLQRHVP